jgi:hypothetical protein
MEDRREGDGVLNLPEASLIRVTTHPCAFTKAD